MFFTAGILTGPCSKSTSVMNNINNGYVPSYCLIKPCEWASHAQYQGHGTGTPKWDALIINVINYTCVFPAMMWKLLLWKRPTAVLLRSPKGLEPPLTFSRCFQLLHQHLHFPPCVQKLFSCVKAGLPIRQTFPVLQTLRGHRTYSEIKSDVIILPQRNWHIENLNPGNVIPA